jgi:phosphoglycerol transferase MdoB-like AlkP superfamily enzyme
MKTQWQIPPRLRLIGRAVFTYFFLFVVLRIAFYFAFQRTAQDYQTADIVKAFQIGLSFDLRLALAVVLPLAIFGWIPVLNPERKAPRIFWLAYFTLITAVIAIFYALDFGFYAYLNGRLNATILKFMENPLISLEMVWQTYPVVWITLGWVVALALIFFLLKKFVFNALNRKVIGGNAQGWKQNAARGVVVFLVYVAGLWGHASQYPLRWSEAFFSGNGFVAAVALNPVLYFADTVNLRAANYEEALVRKYYPELSKYFAVDNADDKTLTFLRGGRAASDSTNRSAATQRPNVIYIVMESFAAYRTKHFGGQFDATPNFDQLAEEGTLFTNFFVPSEATARSLFTVFTSLPDVAVGKTSTRNPLVVNQNSLMNAFIDYKHFYFIGGSASWGNIRGIVANNVDNINIVEEGMYKSPRTDVWGISDLAMFKEADERLAKEKEPFFAVIQTAGYHRPYTIPVERDGFELKELTPKQLEDAGYGSNADYNSLRFSDFALGRFIEIAKKNPYFKNTLFVIHGDHGLPSGRATSLKPGYAQFGLSRWHVPLLLYGPNVMPEPRKIDKIASELDVMPTLAAWARQPAWNNSMGRDLFDPKYDQDRSAFLYVWYQTPPQIGVITDKYYTFGSPGQVKGLYDYHSETSPMRDISAEFPDEAKKLVDRTEGFHETAKYLLYHNPHRDHRTARKP